MSCTTRHAPVRSFIIVFIIILLLVLCCRRTGVIWRVKQQHLSQLKLPMIRYNERSLLTWYVVKNRNVDQRLRLSIIDLALYVNHWSRSMGISDQGTRCVDSSCGQNKARRGTCFRGHSCNSIPVALVALFRFNEGHGNIIQSFGYISSFLDIKNPMLGPEEKNITRADWGRCSSSTTTNPSTFAKERDSRRGLARKLKFIIARLSSPRIGR